MEQWQRSVVAWHEWYTLVGTAAATLTALLFVVVTLEPRVIAKSVDTGVRAFITPTVGLFASALMTAMVMLVPGLTPRQLAVTLACGGVAGTAYLVYVRVQRLWRENKLGLEDWFWYVFLPFAGYGLLVLAAANMFAHPGSGLTLLASTAGDFSNRRHPQRVGRRLLDGTSNGGAGVAYKKPLAAVAPLLRELGLPQLDAPNFSRTRFRQIRR